MVFGDVKRLEVVPLVLDLGALGDREAEPPHDVLQLVDRLRERVLLAQPHRCARQRQVEAAGDRLGPRQLLLASFEHRLDAGLGFVEPLADNRSLGRVDLAQQRLHVAEAAVLAAGEFHAGGFERGGVSGCGDRGQRRLFVGDNFADRIHEFEVRSGP